MIVDRTYKDNWDADDNYANHEGVIQGANQMAMDGSCKRYEFEEMKYYHSHWVGRREYYWYQESEITAKEY